MLELKQKSHTQLSGDNTETPGEAAQWIAAKRKFLSQCQRHIRGKR